MDYGLCVCVVVASGYIVYVCLMFVLFFPFYKSFKVLEKFNTSYTKCLVR